MNTFKSFFSSSRSALGLGLTLGASLLFAGVSFAQSLTIPATIDNMAITIRRIFLSPTGISTSTGVSIELDGVNGIIKTNNFHASGAVSLSSPLYECGGTFGDADDRCNLQINGLGELGINNIPNDNGSTSGDDSGDVFRRSATNPRDSYYATEDGDAAIAGKGNGQQYLRVGVINDLLSGPTFQDTAMVVAGTSETRGDIILRKSNGETLGNEGVNRTNLDITNNYTQLRTHVNTAGSIAFESTRRNGSGPVTPGRFTFSSVREQHFVNEDVSFAPQLTNGRSVSFVFTGGGKTLQVGGAASISDSLIIGHDLAFDPGTDKLSINGSARANAWYYNSDSRYKSDITPLTSALDDILALNGYSYTNKLSNKADIGVIAQEVEKVFPQIVQTDSKGYKSVAYANLVAPLIEAVKELAQKIETLTVSVNTLFNTYADQQSQIDDLTKRLEALEANK